MKPLFNRLAGRHLDDASLAAIWTSMAAAGASVTAGASDPHLASCGECRVRYDAFASWMEEIRTDARLEADEIFTPEMLNGGYRKKYKRATSRILALARDAATS